MTKTTEEKLEIVDGVCLLSYAALLLYQVLIISKYLIPLKIRDRYIMAFYFFSTVMLVAAIMEIIARLVDKDPAFMISRKQPMTFGEICRNISCISYIVLGFIISATMY